MMNMSYCMYENTLQNLRQVFEDMERRFYASPTAPVVDEDTGEFSEVDENLSPLSHREEQARTDLLEMCRDILEMYGEKGDE